MTQNEKVLSLLSKERYYFDDLVTLMEVLRGEGGCPWDREQTHKSIRKDFIEETYEVIEAIDTDDKKLLREELGDVLLQVVFHARIEEEAGEFNIDDVANDICEKLIHRHPHIFADVSISGSSDVLRNWEAIKSEEKSRNTVTDKLRAIPPMLPALMRAQKVGKKASMFDFNDTDAVFSKLYEEISELKDAIENGSDKDRFEELGDVLLTVTSLARKIGVDSEEALSGSVNKFIDRFASLEEEVTSRGLDMGELSQEELDAIYDEQKARKRQI